MRFTNLTRETAIGANSYLVEAADKRVVFDSGMHPKKYGDEATPNFQILDHDSVDAIVVTHSHLDHIGTLPVLIRKQPHATVLMSEAAIPVTEAILHNSVNVMGRQREELGIAGYPLFTHREIDQFVTKWTPVQPGERWSVDGERLPANAEADLDFEFFDAGHIMGSTGVLMKAEGRSLFYTGDVQFDDQTIMRAGEFPEGPHDVLVLECTRGDSPTEPGFTREKEEARLAQALQEALKRGSVLMPIFALGKTQEMLAMFLRMKERGELTDEPIYIGGLSTKITTIYDKLASRVRRNYPGLQLLDTLAPYVISGRSIDQLPVHKGRIYALSSGMMTEETLSNVFARKFIEDANNTIFLVGYSDPESPAGKLRATPLGGEVTLNSKLPPQKRNCAVHTFNFSAHAPREALLDYAIRTTPKTVLLVHGDPAAIEWMKQSILSARPQTKVIVPPPGEAVEL